MRERRGERRESRGERREGRSERGEARGERREARGSSLEFALRGGQHDHAIGVNDSARFAKTISVAS